jgi:hypothetical protein
MRKNVFYGLYFHIRVKSKRDEILLFDFYSFLGIDMECKTLWRSLFCVFILTSCGGYHFVSQENPFSHYGIRTLAIPMAHNLTLHTHISPVITQRITQSLKKYRSLAITTDAEAAKETDAVLIMVVDSPLNRTDAIRPMRDDVVATSGGAKKRQMALPLYNSYDVTVRFVLLKAPTKAEMELLASDLGASALADGKKIIFNKNVNSTATYRTSLGSGEGVNAPGDTNHTNMQANYRKSYETIADSVVTQFEQTIVRAF